MIVWEPVPVCSRQFKYQQEMADDFTEQYMSWLAENSDVPGVREKIDEILAMKDLKFLPPPRPPQRGITRQKMQDFYDARAKYKEVTLPQIMRLRDTRNRLLRLELLDNDN